MSCLSSEAHNRLLSSSFCLITRLSPSWNCWTVRNKVLRRWVVLVALLHFIVWWRYCNSPAGLALLSSHAGDEFGDGVPFCALISTRLWHINASCVCASLR